MSLIKIVYCILLTATAEEQVKKGSNLRNLDDGTFCRITTWVTQQVHGIGEMGMEGRREEGRVHWL